MSEVSLFAAAASAMGLIGIVISVFLTFFQVEPSERIHLTGKEMAFMLVSLLLLTIGIMLWREVSNASSENPGEPDGGDPIVDSQGSDGRDGQDGSEQKAGETGHTISPEEDLSPEELLVKQNWDEIQRLKAQYSKADTETFSNESDILRIRICETAGYVFQDLMETENCHALRGMDIPNVTVVIMNYSTDQILCTLTSDGELGVLYSPGNEKEFYAAAFHDDYDIYVTHPLKVTHGNGVVWSSICLEKKGSQYTPSSRLQLHMLNADQRYTIVPPQYQVRFFMTKSDPSFDHCYGNTTESGILTHYEGTYFSLNTDYTMELYLEQPSEPNWIESRHETFNGPDANSNLTHLYFHFNQENSGT